MYQHTVLRIAKPAALALAMATGAWAAVENVPPEPGGPPPEAAEAPPPAYELAKDLPGAAVDEAAMGNGSYQWAPRARFGREFGQRRGAEMIRGGARPPRGPVFTSPAAQRQRIRDARREMREFGSRRAMTPRHARMWHDAPRSVRKHLGRAKRRPPDCRLMSMAADDEPRPPRAPRAERRRRHAPPWSPRARGEGPFDPEEFKADIQRVRDFMAKHFPERLAELEAFQRDNPDGARRRIRRMFPRVRRMMDMMERNPEAGELMLREERLNFEISRMVDEYFASADPGRLEALRGEIRARVEERFDVRMELRGQEVARLERRLDVIRRQLDDAADHRGERIELELHDLGVFDER